MSSRERFQVRMIRPGEHGGGSRSQPRDAGQDCYVVVDTSRSDAEVARYPIAGRDADAVYHTALAAARQRERDHAE